MEQLLTALRRGSAFDRALDAIEEFRRLESDMPIQFAAGFLAVVNHYVAHDEWPRISDLRGLLGVTQQSATRIAQGLGDDRRGRGAGPRREGLGLITKRSDPGDRRVVRLALSPKGEALLARLADIIA